ncbi:enoyl-CoA hydratase/isomerase family protein [Marinifilum flexuosum]|uniref:Enoyl-CoA hydratase/carnithine racemase n=1 Tax=Marinifilum flexuosum TaxID=1117708 RepID=A0A419WFA4_9BACT|nr:enoyl-CoA hydratase/isomerase family protein [Marinifilum flexuosum]RKD94072.1 enoyl-CoA hydratase/carnithine racemase [Marinifilum flexuosum]
MSKLSITKKEGVANVMISNPPVNILTIEVIKEVNAFINSLKDDKEIKVVLFKSSNNQFFSAHFDLNLINGTPEGISGSTEFNNMIDNIKNMKQLSIAFVDGIARGGGNEFVMACDLAYGTENAAFAQPELGVNIPTGGQGAVQFARRMGRGKALQALLTGADYTAQQAEKLNIITQFIPKSEADTFLEKMLAATRNLDLRDIEMYKEIVETSIRDEKAGAKLELRYFLDRAREDKTQAIFNAFLKHGGQTEREASDFPGLFADTAAELSKQQ